MSWRYINASANASMTLHQQLSISSLIVGYSWLTQAQIEIDLLDFMNRSLTARGTLFGFITVVCSQEATYSGGLVLSKV